LKAFIGTFVLISCVFTPCRSQEPAVQIADIEVRLFYHDSGTFSRDITMADRPDFGFWNTLIGKGDAKEPSSAVLAT